MSYEEDEIPVISIIGLVVIIIIVAFCAVL